MNDLAALRWLLTSPPLLAQAADGGAAAVQSFSPAELCSIEVWLAHLADEPKALEAHMALARAQVRTTAAYAAGNAAANALPGAMEPLRLGRLAERLLEFFLRHGPADCAYRLEACNVPVRNIGQTGPREDATTLGEIDFLLLGPSGQALHWELAVKYYVCHADTPQAAPKDFIGPDAAGSLAGKLHKLTTRQLLLTPPAPWADERWQAQAFTRGWIFYPLGRPIPRCDALAADHLKGWWLPLERLIELPADHLYTELSRHSWLPTCAKPSTEGLWGVGEVAAQLRSRWHAQQHPNHPPHAFERIQRAQLRAQRPSARMLVGLQRHGNTWQEAARYFVLPP